MRPLLLLITLLLLAACGGAANETTPDNAPAVDIQTPQNSTIVYAETLFVSGIVQNPPQQFTLQLVGADDTVLATTDVNTQQAMWQIEFVHGYTGSPTEATVRALSGEAIVDSTAILLSELEQRPEGIYGSLLTPINGTEVGGDLIQVTGRASGLPENSLTVDLVAPDGTVITSQNLTLNNPYFVDDVPWSVDLERGTYTGQATIQAYTLSPRDGEKLELGQVIVTVIEAAG
ncbi:MAG: hypothetical protein OHK0046_02160 [Anaerolineae bacterium]